MANKKDVFHCSGMEWNPYVLNHGKAVYIINFVEIAYHPSENEYISLSGEYIIKSQRDAPSVMIYTLKRDDIRMYISPQASYTFNDIPSLRLG